MNELDDLLTRRAERAPTPRDPDTTVALVVARAADSTRRRRNRLTIASSTAVVVAAAVVGIAVADSGGASSPTAPSHPAVGAPAVGAPAGSTAGCRHGTPVTLLPEISPLHGTATGHGFPIGTCTQNVKAAERRIAAEQQLAQQRRLARVRQERRAAKARSTRRHDSGQGTSLVKVDPAPADAEISLGLVPQGFQYLGLDDADAYYGTPGTAPADYYSDGIVVDVHDFIGEDKAYTLTVDGKPASYGVDDGFTMVRVRYSKTVDVGFQAPPAADLTEAQALQMAASLDVRSTAHLTHG